MIYQLEEEPSPPDIGWSFAVKGPTAWAKFSPPEGHWKQYDELKGRLLFDAAYASIRSTPAPYIGNARLMAFNFNPSAAWDCLSIPIHSGFSLLRVELTLSDRGAAGSRDLHKWVSFRVKVNDAGADATHMLVIRAVESVRVIGVPGPENETALPARIPLPPDLWSPDVDPALPNVPHFVAMEIKNHALSDAEPEIYQVKNMYLLDSNGKFNNRLKRWWRRVHDEGLYNSYSFPTTCSDPYIRTDPFTLAQEQAGRTNRVSVADVARLARPFHGRQKRVLDQYLPHGGYVQNAKKQMLEGGMLEKPAQASLLPSLAGLKV